ncbi:MAG: hypothetical protein HY842_06695 [Bacteroidetes bacterium]|nr:hypothetical protein [Bacteroidota bacterium]
MAATAPDLSILDEPFALNSEQVDFYREHNFVKLKQVFPTEVLAHFGQVVSQKVQELNTQHLPMEQRDTYGKAFLQIVNIWTRSEEVKRFVFGKRLARIATELMGVRGVRMYHDQALFKEPCGGVVVGLHFFDCLAPDFFRMSIWSSSSAMSIIVSRASTFCSDSSNCRFSCLICTSNDGSATTK